VEKNNRTTAADASVDDAAHAGLLDDLMARCAPCFARREARLTCRDMVHGLLAELEDRNCWTLAEAAGHPGPHRMQHLLSRARCDEQQVLDCAADWAAGHLAAGQDWAADEERRELAGVPDEVMFATKPQLAGRLLQHAHDRGIRAGFVAGDEVYGGLDLRKSIRQRGTAYVMAVRSNHIVTLPCGRRLPAKTAASLVKTPCGSGCAPALPPKEPRTTTGR
jgi:SRSO17 transposase